ncbi:DUF4236 domain-containing protein [Streptomyces sp. NPDC041068]|uniref:DUF4236 domain-containing protein n=1 Tax=Streptomyces sp. NPDC041068 TaxID=3155130 RepID=UPI0033C19DD7
MGFSHRKSFKVAPGVRVTASKSGISYSAGTKGARVTKRADGRVQTSISVPGTGIRHTSSSKSRADEPVAERSAHQDHAREKRALEADYRRIYSTAVTEMRDRGFTADELVAQLRGQGVADRRLLRAVDDADKYLKRSAAQSAKQDAAIAKEQEIDELARGAARLLREGMKPRHVDARLKDQGVGFMMRGEVVSRAKKFNKHLR